MTTPHPEPWKGLAAQIAEYVNSRQTERYFPVPDIAALIQKHVPASPEGDGGGLWTLEMARFEPAIAAFLEHARGIEFACPRAKLEHALIKALSAYSRTPHPQPADQGLQEGGVREADPEWGRMSDWLGP